MTIYPTDIKETICPSCGVNKSNLMFTREQEMYRVVSISGKQIKYITATVKVPSCQDCANNTRSALAFPIVLISILLFALIYSSFSGGLPFLGLLLSLLVGATVFFIIWKLTKYGVGVVYQTKSLDNYKPIHIMERYGWQQSKPDNNTKMKSAYTNDTQLAMIMEIVKDGDYMVQ